MEFTEQIAAELKQKYNIPVATINTWRSRGNIPDKYFSSYSRASELTSAQQVEVTKIRQTFLTLSEKINKRTLANVTGINIVDFMRNKYTLTASDIVTLKTHLNEVRAAAKNLLSELNKRTTITEQGQRMLYNFICDKRLKCFVIFKKDPGFHNAISWLKTTKGASWTLVGLDALKAELMEFILESKQ